MVFLDDAGQTKEFPLDSIIDMSGFMMMRIIFSTKDNKFFEINSSHPRSAVKYLDFYKSYKNEK
jgi:hypothetical protein